MRIMKRRAATLGAKESAEVKQAIKLYEQGHSIIGAAFTANVHPSSLYRALQRRKRK